MWKLNQSFSRNSKGLVLGVVQELAGLFIHMQCSALFGSASVKCNCGSVALI